MTLDETHEPARTSWVSSANRAGTPFPIQNLPFGLFRRRGQSDSGRIGVAIGALVLDVRAAGEAGLLPGTEKVLPTCSGSNLNGLMAAGPTAWRDLRLALSRLLSSSAAADRRERAAAWLVPLDDIEMLLPAAIGDYTDFYASIHHATNVGKILRPDAALRPNYKWLPIAYHGRSSSIRASGAPVVRPNGQIKDDAAPSPVATPTQRLDYEAELGFFIGSGNRPGEPIPIAQAHEHLFGVCLLNDWSARDIQAWEYQPLGPFLAKNFATSISPWVVTMDALAPFRVPLSTRPAGDPAPLPYLIDPADQQGGGLDIVVDVLLRSAAMRRGGVPPKRLATVNPRDLYWTPAQMVAHHTMNGCDLRPGDLLGSGTLSGPSPAALGSLLELTQSGQPLVELPGGEKRGFLADGDEVVLQGRCERAGYVSIGLGECRATVLPARPL
jgi:fumarylacetoacetase